MFHAMGAQSSRHAVMEWKELEETRNMSPIKDSNPTTEKYTVDGSKKRVHALGANQRGGAVE